MPDKQKTRNWKDPKTIIATVCIATILTLWNAFATHDRHRTGALQPIASTASATPQTTSDSDCPPEIQAKDPGSKCVIVARTRSS
jgi:hypothetical protein